MLRLASSAMEEACLLLLAFELNGLDVRLPSVIACPRSVSSDPLG